MLGLLDKYSCKVKWTSRTMEEDSSTVISPREHPIRARIVGTFSGSKSVDPVLTPKAWHSSLSRNGRPEFNTHIRASIPSLDPLPFWAFIRSRVVPYTSPKCLPLVTSSNFRLLSETVTPPRIASIASETRKNLNTVVCQNNIMHEMRTMDSATHIPEILCGITLRMSARKVSGIASLSVSISSFFSKYLSLSCAFGLLGTITTGEISRNFGPNLRPPSEKYPRPP